MTITKLLLSEEYTFLFIINKLLTTNKILHIVNEDNSLSLQVIRTFL